MLLNDTNFARLRDLENIESLSIANLKNELQNVEDVGGYLVDIIQGKKLIQSWYKNDINRFREIIEMIDEQIVK